MDDFVMRFINSKVFIIPSFMDNAELYNLIKNGNTNEWEEVNCE